MSPPPYTAILLLPLRTASTAYCIYCINFDLFVSKTMSPPPYITILLYPVHTASTASTVYFVHCVSAFTESTGLTFLHQRQCLLHPLQTASTAYCVHCVLCPLCDCIHCIHWFDLFAPRTISHHHIPLIHCILHPLQPLV